MLSGNSWSGGTQGPGSGTEDAGGASVHGGAAHLGMRAKRVLSFL